MGLLNLIPVKSHNDRRLEWDIDTNSLSEDDLKSAAFMLQAHLFPYAEVYSASDSSDAFAAALRIYADKRANSILIAQDVLRTGKSIQNKRVELVESLLRDDKQMKGLDRNQETHLLKVQGAVLFCRGQVLPRWVSPLFYINSTTMLQKTDVQVKIVAPRRKAIYG